MNINRPDKAKFKSDADYVFALEAYAVDLEKYRDDPAQEERNKRILENRVYVQDVDENFVVVGFPQPLKCSIDISDAAKYKIYFIHSRMRELYQALWQYYHPERNFQMRF